MNKLLKVSMVAILAVGPVAAFADSLSFTNGKNYALQSAPEALATGTDGIVATQAYVLGAYNAVAAAVNDNDSRIGALTSANLTAFGENTPTNLVSAVNSAMAAANAANSGVIGQIQSAVGDGLEWNADDSQITLSSANQSAINGALQTSKVGTGLAYDSTNGLTLSAANQSAIDGALQASAFDTTLESALSSYNYTTLADSFSSTNNTQAVTGSQVAGELANYVTSTALGTTLATYATTSSLSTYATKSYVDNKGVEVATAWGNTATAKIAVVDVVTQ